jgi:hypothetical protein
MSYEGYEQHLCQNGHRFDVHLGETLSCPECEAPSAFCNSVDQTNGEEWGAILGGSWETLRVTSEEYEACNLGHQHLVKPATYRAPTPEELKSFRHWYEPYLGEWSSCDNEED